MGYKRYGVILDEEVYRSWRSEAAAIGVPIGEWITANVSKMQEIVNQPQPGRIIKEASMDESVKKAIEPDKAQVKRGQIRKGLGDLPGESIDREALPPEPKPTLQRDPYREFRPVPKTDKK